MTAKQKDIILGLFIVIVFSFVYLYIIPREVPVLSPVRIAALSPDFWPRNITLLIIFLGAFQVVYALGAPLSAAKDQRTNAGRKHQGSASGPSSGRVLPRGFHSGDSPLFRPLHARLHADLRRTPSDHADPVRHPSASRHAPCFWSRSPKFLSPQGYSPF